MKKFISIAVLGSTLLFPFFTVKASVSETTTLTVGIESGDLYIKSPSIISDFGNLKLGGTAKTLYATLGSINVTDATGSGSGWRLLLQATPFHEVGGANYTLPSNSLTFSIPKSVSPSDNNKSGLPTIQTKGDLIIDNGNQHNIVSAAVGNGMGSFNITLGKPTFSLVLNPSTTKIDHTYYPAGPTPYRTNITWNLVTGP